MTHDGYDYCDVCPLRESQEMSYLGSIDQFGTKDERRDRVLIYCLSTPSKKQRLRQLRSLKDAMVF
jgi:hypothetical protein